MCSFWPTRYNPVADPENLKMGGANQWCRHESEVGEGAKLRGSVGRKSHSGVQERSPGGGLGEKPPEAKKHDVNFVLRITLVNA